MAVTDGKTNSSPTHKPIREFSPSEESSIRAKLESPIPAEGIAYRSSGGGQVAYIEGWRAFNYANEIFGFNGWSSEILNFTTDFLDEEAGKVSVGVSCTVRITLKDGTFHDDIGYGAADNVRSKGAALDKARKEAVTDAIKRALRLFGNHLGNCCYDKDYLRAVKNAPKQPYKPPASVQPPISHAPVQVAARPVFPVLRQTTNDVIMTEEDLITGNDMMDIPNDMGKAHAAPIQQQPPQNSFQPNRPPAPSSIPTMSMPARSTASPSRMTAFQPLQTPNWNQQPPRQPDFRPFNPQGTAQGSLQAQTNPQGQPPQQQQTNDFVKWNPANIQQRF